MPETITWSGLIGRGATSEVYKATEMSCGRIIAVKKFSQVLVQDSESVLRLRSEVAALKLLNHPNIVSLLGEIDTDDMFALKLEFVDGVDLRIWAKNHPLKLMETRLWVLAQVAKGLGHAHEKNIIHRDLKPENILIGKDGSVKLTDFGLARTLNQVTMTRVGLLVGSIGYMAPEVINGKKATFRSDIFSFGVVAYELLSGKSPFEGETPQEVIRKICAGDFQPLFEKGLAVSHRISKLVQACLSVLVEDRPETFWHIEAELMTDVLGSGLLPLVPALVREKVDSKLTKNALEIKLASIVSRVENINIKVGKSIEDKNHQIFLSNFRRDLLHALRELNMLFSGHPLESQILELLSKAPSRSKFPLNKLGKLAALVVAVALVIGAVYWKDQIDHGHLHFDLPEDVIVKVDGRVLSSSERLLFKVKVGPHKLVMERSGYEPVESEVLVNSRETATVSAQGEQN